MCGVFGVSTELNISHSEMLYKGLRCLQHRGEDGAGIAWYSEASEKLEQYKTAELVKSLYDSVQNVKTKASIGHVRYGTQGGFDLEYVQPILSPDGKIAMAFNGQVSTEKDQKDSEALLIRFMFFLNQNTLSSEPTDLTKLIQPKCNEAYSAAALRKDKLFAFRDLRGTRPLFIGHFKNSGITGIAVASETNAFHHLDCYKVDEVEPGTVLEIEAGHITNTYKLDASRRSFCAFEGLYFSREDSTYREESFYSIRKRLGEALAAEDLNDRIADVVIGVPQSGLPAALGYSNASQIPFELGLIKDRYLGRTFIQSSESKRIKAVEEKLHIQRSVVKGKSVLVIDDTIVRGHTMTHIVKQLRIAGAKAVHVRIAAPPVITPCEKGIDTGRETRLPASDVCIETLRGKIGADSLKFLSQNALYTVMGKELCTECFNG